MTDTYKDFAEARIAECDKDIATIKAAMEECMKVMKAVPGMKKRCKELCEQKKSQIKSCERQKAKIQGRLDQWSSEAYQEALVLIEPFYPKGMFARSVFPLEKMQQAQSVVEDAEGKIAASGVDKERFLLSVLQ